MPYAVHSSTVRSSAFRRRAPHHLHQRIAIWLCVALLTLTARGSDDVDRLPVPRPAECQCQSIDYDRLHQWIDDAVVKALARQQQPLPPAKLSTSSSTVAKPAVPTPTPAPALPIVPAPPLAPMRSILEPAPPRYTEPVFRVYQPAPAAQCPPGGCPAPSYQPRYRILQR